MIYDLPTQNLNVDAPPKPTAFEAPEYKDYGSAQMQSIGGTLTQTGSVMMTAAKDMENTMAEAATRERINTLESSVQEMLMNPENGYLTKMSKDAVDGSKPTLDALGELDRKLGDGCKSELEKAMYRQHSGRILKAAKERIFGHHINQAKVWNLGEAEKGVENAAKEQVQDISKDPFWKGESDEVPGVLRMEGGNGEPRFAKGMTPAILRSDAISPEAKQIYNKAYYSGLVGIQSKESGTYDNPYSAKGKFVDQERGHGIGPYQIMEGFWGDFVKKAGMPKGTPRTPENEDYVAAVNWLRLMDKYNGNVFMSAVAWNAGEGAADRLIRDKDVSVLGYTNAGNKKLTVNDFAQTVASVTEKAQGSASVQNAEGKIADITRLSGWGPDSEQAKALKNKYSNEVLVQTINEKLQDGVTDPARIKTFIAAHEKNIDPKQLTTLRTKLSGREGEVFGQSAWDSIAKNLDVNQGPDMASLYAKVEASGLNDDGKRVAYAKLSDLKSKYETGKRANEENVSQGIYGMIIKKEPYEKVVQNILASRDIDNKSRENLLNYAASKYGVPSPQAEATKERDTQNLIALQKFQEEYINGYHGKMKPEDVAKKTSAFGKYTDDAMRFVVHANASVQDVKLTMDDLKNKLRIMKTNPAYKEWKIPDPDGKGDDDKTDLALLQSRVLELMAASAKGGPGKQMSLDAALNMALKDVVTGQRNWGITTTTQKTPRYKLGTVGNTDISTWSTEAITKFINDDFYRVNSRLPTKAEFEKRLATLMK